MKRFFSLIVVLAVTLALLAIGAGDAYATKARNASLDKGIIQVDGIGDLSSGETVEIDANGSMRVKEFTKSVSFTNGDQNDVLSGAAVVYSVTLSGHATSAADYIILSDALTVPSAYVAGTAKVEVTTDITGDTEQIIIPGGVLFATGVSIDATDSGVYCTIVYSSY